MIRRLLPAIHTWALGLWFGSLVMTGIAAAVLFPTLKQLDPTLGAYPLYTGEHWMLAAGRVAERLFFASDIIGFGCAGVAIFSLAIGGFLGDRPWRQVLGALRITLIAAIVLVLSYQLMVLGPRMNTNLRTYWMAAATGGEAGNAAAATAATAFRADHPTAQTVLGVLTALVGVTLLLAGVAPNPAGTPLTTLAAGGTGEAAGAVRTGKSKYEEPAENKAPVARRSKR